MKEDKHVPVRFKRLDNKRVPLCDYKGKCTNRAYKEVYPSLLGKKHKDRGWGYLCRKHYKQEQSFYKGRLPYTSVRQKQNI